MTQTTNFRAVANQINAAYAAGDKVVVNGETVRTWHRNPASIWRNGSLSVDVRTRNGSGVRQLWWKRDATTPPVVTITAKNS